MAHELTQKALLPANVPQQSHPVQGVEALPDEAWALIYRQMRSLVGPRPDLEDLVQAAAERAVRAWPRFEGRSSLSTWTYQIVYRTFLDELRWLGRWRRRFAFWEEVKAERFAAADRTDISADQYERARRLYAALDQLPPAKRAVIVLYELEQHTAEEVATIVGTNVHTVRSRLRDARERLAALLRTDPLFDPEPAP